MWQRSLAVCVLLLPVACTTIRPVEAPVPFLVTARPGAVLIMGSDGNEFELMGPRLQADSLVGIQDGEPVRIALSSVKQMRASQIDRGRTALFAGAVVAGATGLVYLISKSAPETAPIDTSYKTPTVQPRVRSPLFKISIPFLRAP